MGKLAEVLSHPTELIPLIKMFHAARKVCSLPSDPNLAFCYGMLNDVSRSFAVVIQQLENPLRDAICVFYLVLRGLDTVEDDMALPNKVKLPALLSFHEDIYNRNFRMECGYNHYKRLMDNFGIVVDVFLSLEPGMQRVIADITRRMGAGMAKFIIQDVRTIDEYDEYCHYVAGLVGVGLSQLFAASGLESPEYARAEDLSNHMGLFLQKTNIIRDYLEDILEEPAPRMFWPEEIWGRYASTLADFKDSGNRQDAVRCLNHMVLDALRHLPYCIQYMDGLQDISIFRFCAIPQIMAMGTLALCFDNGKVFEGVVKMRRGQTATVFSRCDHMGHLFTWFSLFLDTLHTKSQYMDAEDPHFKEAQISISGYRALVNKSLKKWKAQHVSAPSGSLGSWLLDYTLLTVAGVYFYAVFGLGDGVPGLPADIFSPELKSLHKLVAVLFLLITFRAAVFARA